MNESEQVKDAIAKVIATNDQKKAALEEVAAGLPPHFMIAAMISARQLEKGDNPVLSFVGLLAMVQIGEVLKMRGESALSLLEKEGGAG